MFLCCFLVVSQIRENCSPIGGASMFNFVLLLRHNVLVVGSRRLIVVGISIATVRPGPGSGHRAGSSGSAAGAGLRVYGTAR